MSSACYCPIYPVCWRATSSCYCNSSVMYHRPTAAESQRRRHTKMVYAAAAKTFVRRRRESAAIKKHRHRRIFVDRWFVQPTFKRNIVRSDLFTFNINPSISIPYKICHLSPRPVAIRRQITPATLGTALEHHFRFAAVTDEYGRNRLSQPRTVRIRRVTSPVCVSHKSHTWVGWVHLNWLKLCARSMCQAATITSLI